MRFKITITSIVFILIVALFGPAIPTARAAAFRSGETVVIEADEVIDDDLFVVGETIVINGTINGDLIAAGRLIVHHGTVLGSAALAGQKIRIDDDVNGSVYGAGYSMALEEGSEIGRNVIFRGFALTTRPDSNVGRDIYTNAAQMVHEGTVAGDLNVYVNSLELHGQVHGDVGGTVTAKNVTSWADILPVVNELDNRMPFLRDFASFMPADLDNTYPGVIISSQARVDGEIRALESEDASLALPGRLWASLGEFLGLLFIAAILVRKVPRVVPDIAAILRGRPWPSLGVGVVIYLLLFPLALIIGAALVLLITFIVSLVSLGQFDRIAFGLTGSMYILAICIFIVVAYVLSWIIAGHWIGRRILARSERDESQPWTQFLFVALGVLLLQILHAIPLVGFIVAFFVGAFGLGALTLYWRQLDKPLKAGEPLPEPVGAD